MQDPIITDDVLAKIEWIAQELANDGYTVDDYPFEWYKMQFNSKRIIGPGQQDGYKRQPGEWSEKQLIFFAEYGIECLEDAVPVPRKPQKMVPIRCQQRRAY